MGTESPTDYQKAEAEPEQDDKDCCTVGVYVHVDQALNLEL